MQDQIIVKRVLPGPRGLAWAWLTDSDKTAKWYGPYRAEGDQLFVTLIHEEGQPVAEGRILSAVPESELKLQLGPDNAWIIHLALEEVPGGTQITLTQDKTGSDDDSWIVASWSFYLDCLLAAQAGRPAPKFEDYAPAEA